MMKLLEIEIDVAEVALLLSVVALVIAIPMFVLLLRQREPTPMIGFIVLMLCIAAVVGSLGRVLNVDPSGDLDYWIRITVIATRTAVVGAMLYDIRWLWRHRERRRRPR